jgi:hypothetical protein
MKCNSELVTDILLSVQATCWKSIEIISEVQFSVGSNEAARDPGETGADADT